MGWLLDVFWKFGALRIPFSPWLSGGDAADAGQERSWLVFFDQGGRFIGATPGLKGLCRNPYGGFHSHGGIPIWMVDFMEHPIKMDDLGVPPFQETSIFFPLEFPNPTPTPIH